MNKHRKKLAGCMIFPSFSILLLMSIVPLCMLVLFGFVDGNISTMNGIAGYTLENIKEAFSSLMVGKLMLKSFWIAVLVTFLCILIGYPAKMGNCKNCSREISQYTCNCSNCSGIYFSIIVDLFNYDFDAVKWSCDDTFDSAWNYSGRYVFYVYRCYGNSDSCI